MISLDVYCTLRDWGLGCEVTIPGRSDVFYQRTKLSVPFGFTVYFGPFTIEMRPPPKCVAFQCAVCDFEHTGKPAFQGPVPGFVVCEGCQKKAEETGQMMAIHTEDINPE